MKILVLNSGSSSQKACLFEIGDALPESPPKPLWEGKIAWRDDRALLEVRTSSGKFAKKELPRGERSKATALFLQALIDGETRILSDFSNIDVAGHRIVNGGRDFSQPALITDEVKAAIAKMASF